MAFATALLAASAAASASASARQLPLPNPTSIFDIKVGIAQKDATRLMIGASATLPIPLPFKLRIDADGWTPLNDDFFGRGSGYDFAVLGTNNILLGTYYGLGPAIVWNRNHGGSYESSIGGKGVVGWRTPLGFTVEGSLIVGSGVTLGAVSVGYHF